MKKYLVLGMAVLFGLSFTGVVSANHTWGGYHWARTANPLTLQIGDAVNTAAWDAALNLASSDWNLSTVLETTVVPSKANPKLCRATSGRIEVCNSKYGNNGWLGIAQVWVTGGEHITQGTVKLNDTYFNTAKYNTPEWRNLVTCQEVGHIFGLNHQDEEFTNPNLDTCMDYTNSPASNQHPNAHDYEQLEEMYAHVDTINTAKITAATVRARDVNMTERREWGQEVQKNKRGETSVYRRSLNKDVEVFTFVVWAE